MSAKWLALLSFAHKMASSDEATAFLNCSRHPLKSSFWHANTARRYSVLACMPGLPAFFRPSSVRVRYSCALPYFPRLQ